MKQQHGALPVVFQEVDCTIQAEEAQAAGDSKRFITTIFDISDAALTQPKIDFVQDFVFVLSLLIRCLS